MKATIVIDDSVFARVKQEAAKERRTLSAFVQTALERALREPPRKKKLKPLPTFRGGAFLVDIADGTALQHAMEDDCVYR